MELIIALAITAVTAAILSILIAATALGTTTQQDGRRGLVREQSIKAQFSDAIANARCILDAGPNYLVYWTGDQTGAITPANGAVNLSELRLLEVDTATHTLNLYTCQWPAGYSNASILAADQTYAANTPWYTAAQSAKSTGYFSPSAIASNVTGMTVSLDAASPTAAKLVTIAISFTDGPTARTVLVGETLETPQVPW
jgi:hypothetical protein